MNSGQPSAQRIPGSGAPHVPACRIGSAMRQSARKLSPRASSISAYRAARRGLRPIVAENQRLQGERDEALARVKDLTEQLSESQDDLAAARTSIRRIIRAEDRVSREKRCKRGAQDPSHTGSRSTAKCSECLGSYRLAMTGPHGRCRRGAKRNNSRA